VLTQGSHAYTEKGYLPENFLPEFMDFVVWGHEHECLISPRHNPEMGFDVMQPGSSVATSLMPGESETKHVAVLDITGKEYKTKAIRLKSVRPFVMKEIALQDNPRMKTLAKKENNRTEITNYLQGLVEELIEQAKTDWLEAQGPPEELDEDLEVPLPLIRLRVEYTAPDSGKYDLENPQRFSNRFVGRVANVNDVVQFHRKKTATQRKRRLLFQGPFLLTSTGKSKDEPDMPEESVMAQITLDTVKVEKLVREFLTAQKLTILPQNAFGDAVGQFVDKDDKHAMEEFIESQLVSSVKDFMDDKKAANGTPAGGHDDDDDLLEAMEARRSHLEDLFEKGHYKRTTTAKLKPKPAHWDSDLDGHWADNAASLIRSDAEDDDSDEDEEGASAPPPKTSARGRAKAATSTRGAKKPTSSRATAAKKTTATKVTKSKKKVVEESDEEEEDDVVMLDDDDDEEEEEFPPRKTSKAAPSKSTAKGPAKKVPARAATSRASTTPARQTQLNFGSQAASQRPAARGAVRATLEIVSCACLAFICSILTVI
jgi:double-strand break repair protein MRE11